MASPPEFEITELTAADFDGWSSAFRKFLDFYETSLDEEQYGKTFERLVQKRDGLEGLVVRQNAGGESSIVGFAHFFLTQTTWSEKKIMFLDGKSFSFAPDHYLMRSCGTLFLKEGASFPSNADVR